MEDCFAYLNAVAASESELPSKRTYPTLLWGAGYLRPPATSLPPLAASSGTVTPIHRTCPPWSAEPRCASLRHAPSTVLCARHTESGSAVWKSWVRLPARQPQPFVRPSPIDITPRVLQPMVISLDCGINSVF